MCENREQSKKDTEFKVPFENLSACSKVRQSSRKKTWQSNQPKVTSVGLRGQ